MKLFGRLLAGLLFGSALLATPHASAQSKRRVPPSYAQIGIPDQAEGARILDHSRELSLGGPYAMEFELRVLPKSGDERRIPGLWLGSHTATGPMTRIELAAQNGSTGAIAPASGEFVIVQNGPRAIAWRALQGEAFHELAGDELMRPLARTTISAADLQLPFMYWRDFIYEGLARFRGRPTHVFLLYPPDDQAARFPGVSAARVWVDTEFDAISQAQWVDTENEPLKTITVVSVEKVAGSERYVVKSFEVRDERTRDKTRLTVSAVALDLDIPDSFFQPGAAAGSSAAKLQIAGKLKKLD